MSYVTPSRFAGKTALITGGGSGIGAAVAKRLADEGANVVLMGRRIEPLEAVAEPIGGMAISCDASSGEDVKSAIEKIVAKFGSLDVLVANAGGHGFGAVGETSDSDWAKSVQLNLNTAFVCARESLPQLIKNKGSIVIVSSVAGLFAGPHAAGYVSMKHACIGLGKALARDYGRDGVRTNMVCPAWVKTDMANGNMEVLMEKHGLASIDEAYQLATKDVPLGKPAMPEDVSNVICFLASGEAALMNGAIVTIDGGASVTDLPTLAFVD